MSTPLDRRTFLGCALTGIAAGTVASTVLHTQAASAASPPRIRLGMVTYNLGKDWDIPTLIRHCETTGFEGVELRTTHRHGVEVGLNAAQRAEVKRRFADSKVALFGLGSAFDYHTPDPATLRRDIEATQAYLTLAHDVGATGIKVRPNALPKEVPKEKTLEQIGRALRELGDFAAGLGQQLRLEVHGTETSLLPNVRRIIDVADHSAVGVCWNSNDTDLVGDGFDANFDLVKHRIVAVHMRDLFLENYPFRRLLNRLSEIHYGGFCLAEIPESPDPIRVMRYYRALFLAYQGLL